MRPVRSTWIISPSAVPRGDSASLGLLTGHGGKAKLAVGQLEVVLHEIVEGVA